MPEKQKKVFVLRYYEELPYEEISKILKTSVGGLKANYFHAVKKIAEYVKHGLRKNQYLLVELREGTISQEEREVVERHVATCVGCTEDLKLIDQAFEALRNVEDEEVPTHYFTNFLPRIRERLDRQPARASGFVLPLWLQRFWRLFQPARCWRV